MGNRSLLWLLAIATELSFAIIVPILVLAYAGSWADQHFDTSPLYLIIGALFGAIVGFYNIYTLMSHLRNNGPAGGKDMHDSDA